METNWYVLVKTIDGIEKVISLPLQLDEAHVAYLEMYIRNEPAEIKRLECPISIH